jgi:outer membrane protein
MPRLRHLLLASLMFAAASSGWAQSLQEIYEAARTYDAAYLAARAQADSAQYRAAQADALRLPNVAATGSASRVETDLPTNLLTNPTGAPVSTSLANAEIVARQPLFNRDNAARISQAEAQLQAALADLQIAEDELLVRVAQTYFDVLVAQDALAAAKANRLANAEQLASAKRNFEVGTATITDTREAQARFDLGTAVEIAADNDLSTKRVALDQLVGRTNVAPKPLAVPVSLPALAPSGIDELVAQAQSIHPSVRKADLALTFAKLETERARAGHLPTLDAVARAAATRVSGGSSPGTSSTASLGVQFNLPIYSGYSVQNRIKETLSLEERSRNDLDAARRAVAQATRINFFGYQSGQAQVAALEAAESSSKLALEATQLGYRVGVRVNLDVLNAQTQLFSTQRDLSKARYDVLINGLRLRQSSGTLRTTDINAVNAMLAK